MEILFYRYGCLERENEPTLDAAQKMLYAIEEGGSGYAIGIYDEKENNFYYTNNSVIGQTVDENLEMKKKDLEKIGLRPSSFELYQEPAKT